MTHSPAFFIKNANLAAAFKSWLAGRADTAFFSLTDTNNAALRLESEDSALCLYDQEQCLERYALPVRFGLILDSLKQIFARRNDAALSNLALTPLAILDARSQALHRQGQEISLTGREVDVLLYLHHQQKPVSKDQLLKDVWGYHPDITTHTVETHMWRLRQKIEADPDTPAILITVPEGYRLGR